MANPEKENRAVSEINLMWNELLIYAKTTQSPGPL